MVFHQAICAQCYVTFVAKSLEEAQIVVIIAILLKQNLFSISSNNQVLVSGGTFDSRYSGHAFIPLFCILKLLVFNGNDITGLPPYFFWVGLLQQDCLRISPQLVFATGLPSHFFSIGFCSRIASIFLLNRIIKNSSSPYYFRMSVFGRIRTVCPGLEPAFFESVNKKIL